jgi:hypothetical protein
VENEFEKTDRLMELFFQYQKSLQRAIASLKHADAEASEAVIESTLQSAGQFMLQQVGTGLACSTCTFCVHRLQIVACLIV